MGTRLDIFKIYYFPVLFQLSMNTTFSKESNKMKKKIKDLHLCLQTVDKEYKEMYNKYCQLEEEATLKMSSSTDGSGDVKSKLSSTKSEY